MQKKCKPLSGVLPALLLALVFVLGGCGEDLRVTEEDVVKRTQEEIALLAPLADVRVGNVRADLGGRAVILENVVMVMADSPDTELRIAKITASGIDRDTYEGNPGERTDIDTVVYQEIKVFLEDHKVAELAEYRVAGMNLAWRDLLRTMRDSQDLEADEFSLKIAPYQAGVSAKKITAREIKADLYDVLTAIESLEATDVSLETHGPTVVNKLSFSDRGGEFFSLNKFGYASLVTPVAYRNTVMAPDPESMFDDLFMWLGSPLRSLSPLEINGFYLDGLKITIDGQSVPLSRIDGDLSIKDGGMKLASNLRGLSLTRTLLESQPALRPLAEAAGGRDLLFDGVFNMNTSPAENGKRDNVMRASLSEPDQGEASLDLAFIEVKHPDYDYYRDTLLRSLDFKIEDRGLMDVLLAIHSTLNFGGGHSYAELRRAFLGDIAELREEMPASVASGLDKFADLVKNGGTFRVAMNPAEPVDMDAIEDILHENPDSLSLVFEYAAPAAPKNR